MQLTWNVEKVPQWIDELLKDIGNKVAGLPARPKDSQMVRISGTSHSISRNVTTFTMREWIDMLMTPAANQAGLEAASIMAPSYAVCLFTAVLRAHPQN